MKVTYHIPTETYGFVEVERSIDSIDDIIPTSYEEIKASVVPQNAPGQAIGVPSKEWLGIVENYLITCELQGGAETWEKLNKYQKDFIQECKRAFKRIKAKGDNEAELDYEDSLVKAEL